MFWLTQLQGVPFDEDDAMLNPAPVPNANQYPSRNPHIQASVRQRVISADEDMRRLFEECEIGKGNAQLLNQALTFSRPDELGGPVIGVRFSASPSREPSGRPPDFLFCF